MPDFNFHPGDRVSYCGEEASVVTNDGNGGWVELTDVVRVYWRWNFGGEMVQLVKRKEAA